MAWLDRLLNIVLVVSALILGVLSTKALANRGSSSVEQQANRQVTVPDYERFGKEGQRVGVSEPTVQVVVFSDYQCPFCRIANATLDSLIKVHPKSVVLVWRHYPLGRSHPFAIDAAVAAECAAEQGRFSEYHSALFRAQDSLNSELWQKLATQVNVQDMSAFNACRRGSPALERVRSDLMAGDRLGVTGTPTILVNARLFRGVVPLGLLEGLVRESAKGGHREGPAVQKSGTAIYH